MHDVAWHCAMTSGYSRTSIKRPTSIKRLLSKVPNYLSFNCCIWYLYSKATSIKRPRPPFCCRKVIIYCFFTSITIPISPETLPCFTVYRDLALSIGKANDMFLSLQLRVWQQQTAVCGDRGHLMFFTMIFAFIFTFVHFWTSILLYSQ